MSTRAIRLISVCVILILLAVVCQQVIAFFTPTEVTVTIDITLGDTICVVGGNTTEYGFVSTKPIKEFICNTKELQEATLVFDDKTTINFFLEYNSSGFVAWDFPEHGTCNADWTQDDIATTGNIKLQEKPGYVVVECATDDVTVSMIGYQITNEEISLHYQETAKR